MRKAILVASCAALLSGLLVTPTQAATWQEQVLFEEAVGSGMVLRITARYDAEQRKGCIVNRIETETGFCPAARPFRGATWLTSKDAQNATLTISVIQTDNGQETSRNEVAVPFAGQFIP